MTGPSRPAVPGAVVFDFDGVIANSEPLHFRGFRDVLAGIGVDLDETAYYERYLGYSDAEAFVAVCRDHGRTPEPSLVAELQSRKADLMPRLLADPSILFPGAVRCIVDLAAVVPLAIASGALRGEIECVLDAAAVRERFPVIVAAGETARGKPAPDPYVAALAGLRHQGVLAANAAPSVAIEDSHWGLESARAAGLRTIAVATSYPAGALDADLVLHSLADLRLDHLWTLMQRA